MLNDNRERERERGVKFLWADERDLISASQISESEGAYRSLEVSLLIVIIIVIYRTCIPEQSAAERKRYATDSPSFPRLSMYFCVFRGTFTKVDDPVSVTG